MGAKVEIFLDMSLYSEVLAENLSQRVSVDVKNKARKNVSVDSGRLRNSLRVDRVAPARYDVITDTPYSLAQEYGRPDMPSYTFTPYLRPAAQQASETGNLQRLVDLSSQVALKRSRKK